MSTRAAFLAAVARLVRCANRAESLARVATGAIGNAREFTEGARDIRTAATVPAGLVEAYDQAGGWADPATVEMVAAMQAAADTIERQQRDAQRELRRLLRRRMNAIEMTWRSG